MLNGTKLLLAAADPGPTQTVQNPTAQMLQTILLMGGMVLMVWLLMIRPQQKRAKELENLVKALRAGDKIVTNSGIVGIVLSLKDKEGTLTIRSVDTKFEILKTAVAEVKKDPAEATAS